MSALEILLNSINAQIKEFNKSDYKVYDVENPSFYLDGIEYNSDEDKLYFSTKLSDD